MQKTQGMSIAMATKKSCIIYKKKVAKHFGDLKEKMYTYEQGFRNCVSLLQNRKLFLLEIIVFVTADLLISFLTYFMYRKSFQN